MKSASAFPRSAGILLHPTSLPGPFGVGDFGAGARMFVDWLAAARLSLWQVLPLGPAGPGGSPYSSPSAFALHPGLLDLEELHGRGLLDADDIAAPDLPVDFADLPRALAFKRTRAEKAARAFLHSEPGRVAMRIFRTSEPWVEEFALFSVLCRANDERAWWTWDGPLALRNPEALTDAARTHAAAIEVEVAIQTLLDEQWHALRAYANDRGVRIVGDVPIYVDRHSVEVWSAREQFLLREDGSPLGVAGVPPDAFSEAGQFWGNPLFDWKRMKDDGFTWWKARLARALSLVDVVRIDHFRAFAQFWAIPAGAVDARSGQWVKGPGIAFFEAMRDAFGGLPFILEDLGIITPDVIDLRDGTGLPGMKILQFAFGQGPDAAYLPHNHPENAVVFTGTHDNDTTLGYWQTCPEHVREHARHYLASSGQDFVWDVIRAAFASVAHTAIVPMQDVLVLDGGARMNTAGTEQGNWRWRVREDAFHEGLAARLRELAQLYGRTSLT